MGPRTRADQCLDYALAVLRQVTSSTASLLQRAQRGRANNQLWQDLLEYKHHYTRQRQEDPSQEEAGLVRGYTYLDMVKL
jgi:hypothetical protein